MNTIRNCNKQSEAPDYKRVDKTMTKIIQDLKLSNSELSESLIMTHKNYIKVKNDLKEVDYQRFAIGTELKRV